MISERLIHEVRERYQVGEHHARAYLEYLYSAEGQEIAARNHYRPRDQQVAAKYAGTFAKVKLFTIDQAFGGWDAAQKTHFADGGTFDQIYRPGGR